MATLEPAQVHARLDAISHALVHMAPVMLYVGERCYSNLGRFSNLPGRSLAPGAEGSVLTALRDTPVPRWKAEDATFVACMHALISSGSPVRAEEFNGIQLAPDVLREFLRERISAYGEPLPDTRGLPAGAALDLLSGACARARAALVADGAVFYREINGASLHKRERRMAEPVTWAELPPELTALLAEAAGLPFPYAAGPEELGSYTRSLVERVTAGPVPAGFTTAYEGFLHRFFETVAEALDCDVVMGAAPRTSSSCTAPCPPSAGRPWPPGTSTAAWRRAVPSARGSARTGPPWPPPCPRTAPACATTPGTTCRTACRGRTRSRAETTGSSRRGCPTSPTGPTSTTPATSPSGSATRCACRWASCWRAASGPACTTCG
ncbi:hypothetical protein WKI68_25830 [Streptomyces sp. MS1.HAVA.3]|uniref:Uncharacterized protein n=1 Tax=Streptomyces caledonius TaxID=3134107 RepID=A0ABU8U7K6_9ACTN